MGYYKWSESVSNLLVSEQCLFGLWCPDQSWAVVLASYSLTCLLSQSCHWSACDPLFYVHHPMSRCVPAPGSLSTVCSAPCLRPQSRLRAGAETPRHDVLTTGNCRHQADNCLQGWPTTPVHTNGEAALTLWWLDAPCLVQVQKLHRYGGSLNPIIGCWVVSPRAHNWPDNNVPPLTAKWW